MTITKTGTRRQYTGNGATTAFAFDYRFFADTDLEVSLTVGGTTTVQTLTTHYTVSNTGTESGGTVTFLTAPATGATVTIQRAVPRKQLTDYVANDAFPAETHEAALDKLTLIVQDTHASISDAVTITGGTISGATLDATNSFSDPKGTREDLLMFFKTPEDFGAVGDGTADDTTALNNCFAGGGRVIGKPGAIYKVTASVNIPSNISIDMNGAKIKRVFVGGWALRNSTGLTTADNTNIVLRNLWLIDDGTVNSRGNFLWLNGASGVEITNYRVEATAGANGLEGAWGAWLAGNDIRINGYTVNNFSCGLYGDGLHLGQVNRFVMTNFNIVSGDDCISLHYPPNAWGWLDGDSDGIVITGGYLKSSQANGVRLGAYGAASSAPPSDTGVWKNVLISDVDIDPTTTNALRLFDDRTSGEIASKQNGPIQIANMRVANATSRSILLTGNADITNAANYSQRNFGTVSFSDLVVANNAGQLFYGGGVDALIFTDCILSRIISGAPSDVSLDFRQIAQLVLKDCFIQTDGTGVGLNLNMCARTTLENCEIVGTNAEFALVQLVKNTTFDSILHVTDGRISSAARLLHSTGTGNIAEFVCKGTVLENASTSLNTITSAVTRYIHVPADNLTFGTYTPTLFNTTNVAASTAHVCQYLRVGNAVTVSFKVEIDPTAATTDTVLGMSLPIASNLTNEQQLAGSGANITAGVYGEGIGIIGDVTNDRALLRLRPSTTPNQTYTGQFTYTVA